MLLGPNGGTIVRIRPRSWLEMLPDPWCTDPNVVVVMAPIGSVSRTAQTRNGYSLGVLEHNGGYQGLQVLYPQLATYPAHSDVFDAVRIPMMSPRYIGPLSNAPSSLISHDDLTPLLFVRDQMWRPYLEVRRYIAELTKGSDESN